MMAYIDFDQAEGMRIETRVTAEMAFEPYSQRPGMQAICFYQKGVNYHIASIDMFSQSHSNSEHVVVQLYVYETAQTIISSGAHGDIWFKFCYI